MNDSLQQKNFSRRIAAVQATLQPTEALLVSRPSHLLYLCGFSELTPHERECFLVITPTTSILYKSLFSLLTPPHIPHFAVKQLHKEFPAHMKSLFAQENISTLIYDPEFLSVAEYYLIQDKQRYQLLTQPSDVTMEQRLIKDELELQWLREANRLTISIVEGLLKNLTANITELELSHELEHLLIQAGADGVTFPTIVAFGEHAAIPHHQPTSKKLTKETVVLIDSGAKFQGYSADMTRTIWFGNHPSPQFSEIKAVVDQAYQAAIALLSNSNERDQLTAQRVDQAARQLIEERGFGGKFIHTTGHGIGIDVHEPPSLNTRNTALLKPGTCFTIEPGIYLPGEFGYRYENSLVLTEQGYKVLGMDKE